MSHEALGREGRCSR